MADTMYRTAVAVLNPMISHLFRTDVVGLHNVPLHGPVIIASNHISYLDPIVLGKAILKLRPKRRLRFLAKAELFEKQPLEWAMRNLGQIPVDRGTVSASDSLRSARLAIEEGKSVVIFPEGTISAAFVPMKPHSGVGRLALDTGAPVVPTGIWGTHRSMTKYRERDLARRRPATVDFGASRAYREGDPRSVTEDIMRRVVECVVSARSRYPEIPGPDDWWGPPQWPAERVGKWRPKLTKDMSREEALAAVAAALACDAEDPG